MNSSIESKQAGHLKEDHAVNEDTDQYRSPEVTAASLITPESSWKEPSPYLSGNETPLRFPYQGTDVYDFRNDLTDNSLMFTDPLDYALLLEAFPPEVGAYDDQGIPSFLPEESDTFDRKPKKKSPIDNKEEDDDDDERLYSRIFEGDDFFDRVRADVFLYNDRLPPFSTAPYDPLPSVRQHSIGDTTGTKLSAGDESYVAGKQKKGKPKEKDDDNFSTEILYVKEITAFDVLLGRGERSNRHNGNLILRKATESCRPRYLQAETRKEKAAIAQALVDFMRRECRSRFLVQDPANHQWYIANNDRILEKVKQGLREHLTPEDRKAKRMRYAKKQS